jgi:hypothetical protein
MNSRRVTLLSRHLTAESLAHAGTPRATAWRIAALPFPAPDIALSGEARPVPSTSARQNGNLWQTSLAGGTMSKPVRTQAELIEMAKAELKVHADPPDGMLISILRDGDGWEFRVSADKATQDKPGYPEAVAMLVQIGDHLSKQYDVKG